MDSSKNDFGKTQEFLADGFMSGFEQQEPFGGLRFRARSKTLAADLTERVIHLADKLALEQEPLFRQEYVDRLLPALEEALRLRDFDLFETVGLKFCVTLLHRLNAESFEQVLADQATFSADLKLLLENLGALTVMAKTLGQRA